MRLVRKESITKPITNPRGEIVYELIGASARAGGTKHHSFALITLPPGKSSEPHYHKESEETFFVLKGTARFIIDNTDFELIPGDACFIEPLEKHQIVNLTKEELEYASICAPPWVIEDSVFTDS